MCGTMSMRWDVNQTPPRALGFFKLRLKSSGVHHHVVL
jgi:hypothetical protein